MSLSRREFMQLLGMAGAANLLPASLRAEQANHALYDVSAFGNVTLMHFTDCHAQLKPIYFREPSVNLGLGPALGQVPHVVGQHFLQQFGIQANSRQAHALTYLDFDTLAKHYGRVGGFAHLATLVQQIRASRPVGGTLLLDGGDTWQGSGTAYWTQGQDMLGACNLLGVDVMTGHWEFTYQDKQVRKNIEQFNGQFLAQNIKVEDEALFEGAEAFDEDSGHAFQPYAIKTVGGARIAVIGQAFPYTPIANPKRFIPEWTFGINDQDMQALVNRIRSQDKPDAVVVLSHNGMDVDLKMATRVTGIDVILGGHTHDGIVKPIEVPNARGKTLVTNAGSNGKFLGVMDLDIRQGQVQGYRYRLLPVFSNLLPADPAMAAYIEQVRAPYEAKLQQPLAVADETLYRRGNFNGTFDQVICDALRDVNDAQIALSPGFRWGTTVLPGQTITMEHVLDQTCVTYPETYTREMTGQALHEILEDVADNLFNLDPYLQQGGDMVRVGGMDYTLAPRQSMGARVTDMRLDNGQAVMPNKTYKVSGWATVNSVASGEPVWDTVARYLKAQKTISVKKRNTPHLKGVQGNPGIGDYP